MTPLIQDWHIVAAFVAFAFTLAALWIADVALRAAQRWLTRRRRVLGRRVPAPQWRARRLHTGQWIVERRP